MPSTTRPAKALVQSLNELRVFLFCLAVFGLLACCSQASGQCYSCESAGVLTDLSYGQSYGHGAISGEAYYSPSFSNRTRGFETRSGIPHFSHLNTPRGVQRRIPGNTFPVQTVVVNFTPPGSYSSPRQTSFRKNAFGRSVISRW